MEMMGVGQGILVRNSTPAFATINPLPRLLHNNCGQQVVLLTSTYPSLPVHYSTEHRTGQEQDILPTPARPLLHLAVPRLSSDMQHRE
jgi:hypothetical protein